MMNEEPLNKQLVHYGTAALLSRHGNVSAGRQVKDLDAAWLLLVARARLAPAAPTVPENPMLMLGWRRLIDQLTV